MELLQQTTLEPLSIVVTNGTRKHFQIKNELRVFHVPAGFIAPPCVSAQAEHDVSLRPSSTDNSGTNSDKSSEKGITRSKVSTPAGLFDHLGGVLRQILTFFSLLSEPQMS